MARTQRRVFPFRAHDRRWETPLGRFVDFFGADELAERIDVHKTAVYQYVSGATLPHPAKAFAIRRIARSSGFSISLDDIYQHFRESGAAMTPPDSETPTQTRRRVGGHSFRTGARRA